MLKKKAPVLADVTDHSAARTKSLSVPCVVDACALGVSLVSVSMPEFGETSFCGGVEHVGIKSCALESKANL